MALHLHGRDGYFSSHHHYLKGTFRAGKNSSDLEMDTDRTDLGLRVTASWPCPSPYLAGFALVYLCSSARACFRLYHRKYDCYQEYLRWLCLAVCACKISFASSL